MIKFKDVIKKRDTMTVGPISASIPNGSLTLIAGKNSKGKSTILKLLSGIIEMDSGSIIINDKDLSTFLQNEGINYMPDQFPYYEKRNAPYMYSNWMKDVYPYYDKNQFREYAKRFGVALNKPIIEMSKGEKKRTLLALTFANTESLILLDEPSLNLDSNYRTILREVVQEKLLDETNTLIIASNNVEDFDTLADYLVYLKDGKVYFEGYTEDILDRYMLWSGTKETLPEQTLNTWETEYTTQAIIDKTLYPKLELERLSLADLLHNIERMKRYESLF